MIDLDGLLDRWAADEERFRTYGQDATADVIARCRADLAGWWQERMYEGITLEEGAAYSGLSPGTIGNKVRAGEIPNVGRKHAPRVRRCDLPAKPSGTRNHREAIDLADRILRQ